MSRGFGLECSLVFVDSDEQPYLLDESQTLGRHLDNDLIISGEDVYDFHARIDITPRGPNIVAVNKVPLRVNGKQVEAIFGLAPGDIIEIGHTELLLRLRANNDNPISDWRLVAKEGAVTHPLHTQITVGRTDESDLVISDGHVSRRHAIIFVVDNLPWVRDLNSANGTYINNQEIIGSALLFHGDEVCFDKSSFQIIGRGADLTPVRSLDGQSQLPISRFSVPLETIEMNRVEIAEVQTVDEISIPGCYLIGMTEPILNQSYLLAAGRTTIGRHLDSDIVIDDVTVSHHHAELHLNSDGCLLTAQVTKNGTQINGREVTTDQIENLDVVQIGGVKLGYRVIETEAKPGEHYTTYYWLVGGLILAAAIVAFMVS